MLKYVFWFWKLFYIVIVCFLLTVAYNIKLIFSQTCMIVINIQRYFLVDFTNEHFCPMWHFSSVLFSSYLTNVCNKLWIFIRRRSIYFNVTMWFSCDTMTALNIMLVPECCTVACDLLKKNMEKHSVKQNKWQLLRLS